MAAVGSGNVTVTNVSVNDSGSGNTIYTLDYKPTGTIQYLTTGAEANPLRILAKPSAYLKVILRTRKV